MPLLYRTECGSCGHDGPMTADLYWAVYCDDPYPTPFLHPDDPHLAVLRHPGEQRQTEAIQKHLAPEPVTERWVKVDLRYCRGCGHLFEVRRLTTVVRVGCWLYSIGLLLSVAVGSGIALLPSPDRSPGFVVGVFGALGTCLLVALLLGGVEALLTRRAQRRMERRHPDRVRRVNTARGCPHCQIDDSREPGRMKGPIPCLGCGGRSAVVKCVAIS
jgi:hypothetical protein